MYQRPETLPNAAFAFTYSGGSARTAGWDSSQARVSRSTSQRERGRSSGLVSGQVWHARGGWHLGQFLRRIQAPVGIHP